MSSDNSNFVELVSAIARTHATFAAQASKAVNMSLTLRNWFIGHHIAEYELQGADRAVYGEQLLAELATALRGEHVSNVGKRQLYSYLSFYRSYPQIVRTASAQSAKVLLASASALERLRKIDELLEMAVGEPGEQLIGIQRRGQGGKFGHCPHYR